MHFSEHGVFEIKVEDQVLIVDGTGPYNEEIVLRYKNALEDCIQFLEKTGSWSQIIILHSLSVFTPDAEKLLLETIIDRRSRGLVASAVVFGDWQQLGKPIVREQLGRCYRQAEVSYDFFDDVDDARAWIQQQALFIGTEK